VLKYIDGSISSRRPQTLCPMIKKLAHLCLFTDQLDNMIAFYRDVMGFPVKFTMKNDDGFAFGYYFATGEMSFVEIFDQKGAVKQWGGTVGPIRQNNDTHMRHFCFEVNGIEALVAELEAKNIKVRPLKIGMDHSKQAWIKDPDGNDIELMEYTPKSLQW
jgi:lactoylglutathione lyase